jgi:hypothetical protein
MKLAIRRELRISENVRDRKEMRAYAKEQLVFIAAKDQTRRPTEIEP